MPSKSKKAQADKEIFLKWLKDEQFDSAKQNHKIQGQRAESNAKIKQLLEENSRLERELEAALNTSDVEPFEIEHKISSGNSEVTAVALASDWHIEERVDAEKVNGMNEYSMRIAEKRAIEYFQNVLKLVKKEQQGVKIDTLVIALLGDFISGNIHEALLEICEMPPVAAIMRWENICASGIEYILKNSKLNLVIPCHVGNHPRVTKKVHHSTEQENNLEWIAYHHLQNHFRDNDRVKFLISNAYHSYVDIYGFRIRFHHGHAIKYQGGIGGLSIPAYKAISQWQKIKPAYLDCFGHHHQTKDGGNFLCNGSLIGYNAFAVAIKADFEKPKQTFFLIDKKRGKTGVFPIMYSI